MITMEQTREKPNRILAIDILCRHIDGKQKK